MNPRYRKGAVWKKGGQHWRITEDAAGIVTLEAGNGRRPPVILHISELEKKYVLVRESNEH